MSRHLKSSNPLEKKFHPRKEMIKKTFVRTFCAVIKNTLAYYKRTGQTLVK